MRINHAFAEVGKKILFLFRWFTLIVYVAFVVLGIYGVFQWKDTWLYPRVDVKLLLSVGVIGVLIPVIALLLLFYKSKKAWQFILQAVVQLVFIWFSPALLIVFGLVLPGGIWNSATTELENYHVFEEDVEDHLNYSDLDIIPSALPENIEEVSYSYRYSVPLDSVLKIDASWQYLDEAGYEQEKERVLQKGVTETYEENGYTVCRMKKNASNSSAEFGYNDETKVVFYRINGIW